MMPIEQYLEPMTLTYFDHNATTSVDDAVLEEMLTF